MKSIAALAVLPTLVAALLCGSPASAATLDISSVEDWGQAHDGLGKHSFVLRGTFPPVMASCPEAPWANIHGSCYGVTAYCSGAIKFGTIETIYPGDPGIILVGFEEFSSDSYCSFSVKAPLGNGEGAEFRYSAGEITSPPIEIHGVADAGITGGYHYFELYGYFPVGGNFYPEVVCDGQNYPAYVQTPNNPSIYLNQINIFIPDYSPSLAVDSLSCQFRIKRLNDNVWTPRWYQRVNGSKETAAPISSLFGTYYWGGFAPDWLNRNDTPRIAVKRLRDAGVTGPVRFALSPAQAFPAPNGGSSLAHDDYYDYGAPGLATDPACTTEILSGGYLPRSVCTNRMKAALAETRPNSTVILTAMDSASFFDSAGVEKHNYVYSDWMQGEGTTNFLAVKNEYKKLAKALYATQTGNKTFVIANWEGDNQLFCSDAYKFISYYGGSNQFCTAYVPNPSLEDEAKRDNYIYRKQALTNWLLARKQGIDEARSEAGATPQIYVYDGIEFSTYRMIQSYRPNPDPPPATFPFQGASVLHGIIPQVLPRYALYSAWESTGNGRVDQDLREISEYLSQIQAPTPIKFMLGEFAYGGQITNLASATNGHRFRRWLLTETVRAAKRVNVLTSGAALASYLSGVVMWQAFDTIDQGQGMLSVEGVETNVIRAVAAGAASETLNFSFRLYAVREVEGSRTASNRYFELYGVFGSGPYAVERKCYTKTSSMPTPGSESWVSVSSPTGSSGQLNITVPLADTTKDWWCLFRAKGNSGIWTPTFGPIRSCDYGICNAPSLP